MFTPDGTGLVLHLPFTSARGQLTLLQAPLSAELIQMPVFLPRPDPVITGF